MPVVSYSSISPGVLGWHSAELLNRAMPYLILEKFAQAKETLPGNKTKSVIFSRYAALSNSPVPLTEGVTPAGKTLSKTDITLTMRQFGDFVEITDQVIDMHCSCTLDPVAHLVKHAQLIVIPLVSQIIQGS